MQKTFTFAGNIRRNSGGQIVVDLCKSDLDHHRNAVTDPAQNRPLCRKTVEACFDDLIGKAGKLAISIHFEEDCVGAQPLPLDDAHTAVTAKQVCSPAGTMADALIASLEECDGN